MVGASRDAHLGFLLIASAFAALAQATNGNGVVSPAEQCDGYEKSMQRCPGLPKCGTCKPVNCEFQDWAEWHPEGGCSGLKIRSRSIMTANNECGKPCVGPKTETDKVDEIKPECKVVKVDCELSGWDDWSSCISTRGQTSKSRTIKTMPENGGKPCDGPLKVTKPCNPDIPVPKKCEFDDWQAWTSCSTTCGPGRHTRSRRIQTPSEDDGEPCAGPLLQAETCDVKKCDIVDCKFSDWSDWGGACDNGGQLFRNRYVQQPASFNGTHCSGNMRSVKGCSTDIHMRNCVVHDWNDWADCDKSCDGGQSFRKRLVTPPSHGGEPCDNTTLQETRPCNDKPCKDEQHCVFSAWNDWGKCDATCGAGSKSRDREVKQFASGNGIRCVGPIEELIPCKANCPVDQDCKWGDWEGWTACTCTCGGGTKHRNRLVIQAPRGNGKLCEAETKSEVGPCNDDVPCENIEEGKWEPWGKWMECSQTCDVGFRKRHRKVERYPTGAAPAMEGLTSEYEKCEDLPACEKDIDCEISTWSSWSDCSCSCFGIRERTRVINTFVRGHGKPCDGESMKEINQCNTHVDGCIAQQQDCKLSDWSNYAPCSRTCGGGQKERSRLVQQRAQHGGQPCNGTLKEVRPCNVQLCEEKVCVDCEFDEWSSWSACFGSGTTGQRIRHRGIATMPNYCGKPCEKMSAREIEPCVQPGPPTFVCRWSEWSDAHCQSEGCGVKATTQSRVLGLKKLTSKDMKGDGFIIGTNENSSLEQLCTGTQLNMTLCPEHKCETSCKPVDCKWGDWHEWANFGGTGLCERSRTVARAANTCGKVCLGPLVTTKACVDTENPVDCTFADWEQWSPCIGAVGQKFRSRKVLTPAKAEGKACTGPMKMTAACGSPLKPVRDCEMSDWSEWDQCTVTCGGALTTRVRRVTQHANCKGLGCEGSLKQFKACGDDECPVEDGDCVLGDWSGWSGCYGDGQKYNTRKIEKLAKGGGKDCGASLEITQTCVDAVVDCEMSGWTDWDQCDKVCGGGQQIRQRQIHKFPKFAGVACPKELMETRGCNMNLCDVKHCELEEWAHWSECSATCGVGQKERSRQFVHLRGLGGKACEDRALKMTIGCKKEPCEKVDCEWDEWQDWGDCTCSCGGGQRVRNRHIKVSPRAFGEKCAPKDKEEIVPCNTQVCGVDCIDGSFHKWSPWSKCTSSCGGGSSRRVRSIAQQANICGKPAVGNDREVRVCNTNTCIKPIDCEFGDWSHWSDCSLTCEGIKRRSRRITQYGRGTGKYCTGAAKQTSPCNPDTHGKLPKGCGAPPTKDCKMGNWKDWSACTVKCGGGYHQRKREIEQHASNGGEPCNDTLAVVSECNRDECDSPNPVDCVLGDWQDWGGCAKCGGTRKRFRDIMHQPEYGGKDCPASDTEQVGGCPQQCIKPTYCSWHPWGEWSECSATCGEATRVRKRALAPHKHKKKHEPPVGAMDLLKEYNALKIRTDQLEQDGHMRDISAAFILGGISLSFVFAAWRLFTKSIRSHRTEFSRVSLAEATAEESHHIENRHRSAPENEMAVPLTNTFD